MVKTPLKRRTVLRMAGDAKTIKGQSLGIETAICYLAPADSSGVIDVCSYRTKDCTKFCLNKAGRGGFNSTQIARIAKTVWFATDRQGFMEQTRRDILSLRRLAKRNARRPAVRFNGTSDRPDVAMALAKENPDLMFYDYTKIPRPWLRQRENYRITFSYSGENLKEAMEALAHGVNVSVVFMVKKGSPLPELWKGFKVIDGDEHDCRFLDPKGVVVGLRAKGPAKKALDSPFVILS